MGSVLCLSRLNCHQQHWHFIQVPVRVPPAPLRIQLPANGLGKAAEGDLSTLDSTTHTGILEEAPGSWHCLAQF